MIRDTGQEARGGRWNCPFLCYEVSVERGWRLHIFPFFFSILLRMKDLLSGLTNGGDGCLETSHLSAYLRYIGVAPIVITHYHSKHWRLLVPGFAMQNVYFYPKGQSE